MIAAPLNMEVKEPAPSAYETPTAEKIAMGKRLRQAREIAGLTLTEAAAMLGYAQPVQLSYIENGQRLPPLRILMACAELFGTTTDFLCGFAADADRDPAVAAQSMIAARVTAEVRTLIERSTKAGIDVARALRPDAGRIMRMACCVIEATAALELLRKACPEFDTLHASSRVLAKLDTATDLAREHLQAVERARRASAAGMAELALGSGSADDDGVVPLGYTLRALKALVDPGPHLEDGEDDGA
jgi:transcriptional regulator with XRE-family HTH domain